MTPVMKKLKSKSGISLAIALVFFLLCAMVGTVVLSAATVSAGNTARERQLYRETLAMTSASQLLRSEIKIIKFEGSCVKTETVTTVVPSVAGEKTQVTTSVDWTSGTTTLKDGTFLKDDNLDLRDLYLSNQKNIPNRPASLPVEKTLTIQAADPDKGIPEVTGKLTVAADYTITVVLQCGQNSMTMTFHASTDVGTTIAGPTVEVNNHTTTKTTVTTYTTTVTWGAPTIREGGAVA